MPKLRPGSARQIAATDAIASGLRFTMSIRARCSMTSKEGADYVHADQPSIVFVHGIWADGSSFGKVIPTLQAEGYEVVAAQHSLDTLKGDVATVTRTLRRGSAPAKTVGPSYGRTVITPPGTPERGAGVVYIAAPAPDDGQAS